MDPTAFCRAVSQGDFYEWYRRLGSTERGRQEALYWHFREWVASPIFVERALRALSDPPSSPFSPHDLHEQLFEIFQLYALERLSRRDIRPYLSSHLSGGAMFARVEALRLLVPLILSIPSRDFEGLILDRSSPHSTIESSNTQRAERQRKRRRVQRVAVVAAILLLVAVSVPVVSRHKGNRRMSGYIIQVLPIPSPLLTASGRFDLDNLEMRMLSAVQSINLLTDERTCRPLNTWENVSASGTPYTLAGGQIGTRYSQLPAQLFDVLPADTTVRQDAQYALVVGYWMTQHGGPDGVERLYLKLQLRRQSTSGSFNEVGDADALAALGALLIEHLQEDHEP